MPRMFPGKGRLTVFERIFEFGPKLRPDMPRMPWKTSKELPPYSKKCSKTLFFVANERDIPKKHIGKGRKAQRIHIANSQERRFGNGAYRGHFALSPFPSPLKIFLSGYSAITTRHVPASLIRSLLSVCVVGLCRCLGSAICARTRMPALGEGRNKVRCERTGSERLATVRLQWTYEGVGLEA